MFRLTVLAWIAFGMFAYGMALVDAAAVAGAFSVASHRIDAVMTALHRPVHRPLP
jgi:hypothetical protein